MILFDTFPKGFQLSQIQIVVGAEVLFAVIVIIVITIVLIVVRVKKRRKQQKREESSLSETELDVRTSIEELKVTGSTQPTVQPTPLDNTKNEKEDAKSEEAATISAE